MIFIEFDEFVFRVYNEIFVLIVCVCYGEVLMENGDLEFIYFDWEMLEYFVEILWCEYWVIFDGKFLLFLMRRVI